MKRVYPFLCRREEAKSAVKLPGQIDSAHARRSNSTSSANKQVIRNLENRACERYPLSDATHLRSLFSRDIRVPVVI